MDNKVKEVIIVQNGKMLYAIKFNNEDSYTRDTFIYIDRGEVHFSDYVYNKILFNDKDENHVTAKVIFTTQLKSDIKRKILELKQLQAIFRDLNIADCLDDAIYDNAKILLGNDDDKRVEESEEKEGK